jgi:uncharacterized sporulation protein YeaH/YhbH (DUF444 family)
MTTKKITGDHSRFKKLVAGKVNERISKFIRTGHITKMRPNGKGKMSIPIPQIDQYRFRYGKMDEGAGRGPGKPGDTIDKEYEPGHGPGAGDGEKDAMLVDVDMEDVLQMMEKDLRLPRMKPKESQTYENVEIKYLDISKTGPRSLIHKRRSIKQAIKRNIAQGTFGKKVLLPGYSTEIPLLQIQKDDFFYRQWQEVKIPRANALIVFGRDGSGSMDDFKCNLVSDLSWWIDTWIKRDYVKSETLYLWHDMEAKEVSQHDFYHLRHGGGTKCSSVVNLLKKTIELKYPPKQWNIYFFYFGDGDNLNSKDNELFMQGLKDMEPHINLFGMGQILADKYEGSLKEFIDDNTDMFNNNDFVRTTAVGGDKGDDDDDGPFYEQNDPKLDEDMRKAIVDLLGNKKQAEDTDLDLFYNEGAGV